MLPGPCEPRYQLDLRALRLFMVRSNTLQSESAEAPARDSLGDPDLPHRLIVWSCPVSVEGEDRG